MAYTYWLEDVDFNGVKTRHGPISVTFNQPTAVGLAAFTSARKLKRS